VWQQPQHFCLARTHTMCAYCLRFTNTAVDSDLVPLSLPCLQITAYALTEIEVTDAAVPVESIKRQLVLEEISRSGEMGGTTYRCVYFYFCYLSFYTDAGNSLVISLQLSQ